MAHRISETDIRDMLGPVDGLVMRELVQTKASLPDLRRAFELTKGALAASDLVAFTALPARMRRLVDLLSIESKPEPSLRNSARAHQDGANDRAA